MRLHYRLRGRRRRRKHTTTALKPPGTSMLEKLFQLRDHATTVRTEIVAGLTTFLTMSYIIFLNPDILSSTGMDRNAVFVATCLAAALGSLIMALVANWPIGMAPGMGLNAFFAFTVVKTMGYTWEQALGAVFISGVIFLFLTISGIRAWLIRGIPHSLRSAIAAGIGLFLAIIALSNANIVVAHPATKVTLGDLREPGPLFAILGFFIIAALDALRVRGAILIGILSVTVLSMLLGYNQFNGIFSSPPSLAPTFMQLDILGALHTGFVHVILVFVLVEVFDATGTLMGIAKRAGLVPEDRPNRLGRALFADSTAIVAGSMLGTSSTTAYVESASGVQAGGRTGLTALVVALLFLAALFIAPLAGSVPAYATAPALLYVAGLMMRELIDIDWNDVSEATPAALTALVMPFTYSIANGLAFGFISYVVLKTCTGRIREVHPATWLVAILFIVRYAFFPE
ncbi:permease family protein [Bordetella pertussis H973]|nr:permease family protein [Bordetella pertussis CHLA-11]ETH01661.1 permease family protein [Bordetella pertussis 2250905]ETH04287.1 permease family protein [Bordetella pertussis 2356847]ETH06665.1 permease family protein [Bordetella pertussis 2371640]ETH12083.1 permease family protein [Bordetella pertussis STO1-SEAT-0006]ETH17121.1 permease family protein [Bordetella pertussis STO1-SEAT-0007]ETH19810.1 permease family protein [Bordetella pertussis CHLA-13]ETH23155.1 permease family protein 